MSKLLVFLGSVILSAPLAARTVKTEVVSEQERAQSRVFCSKVSGREAADSCEKWLSQQSKSLGERLLTSSCSSGEMSGDAECLYRATGELRFVLKTRETETDRTD